MISLFFVHIKQYIKRQKHVKKSDIFYPPLEPKYYSFSGDQYTVST